MKICLHPPIWLQGEVHNEWRIWTIIHLVKHEAICTASYATALYNGATFHKAPAAQNCLLFIESTKFIIINITVIWDATPRNLVEWYQRLSVTFIPFILSFVSWKWRCLVAAKPHVIRFQKTQSLILIGILICIPYQSPRDLSIGILPERHESCLFTIRSLKTSWKFLTYFSVFLTVSSAQVLLNDGNVSHV
jgi:hypothetical protein